MLAQNGALADLIAAGARILECACGPCIGMGQSPNSEGISLRTFNRNFEGRSGTADGQIYLVSPETAAASALTGVFTDPQHPGRRSAKSHCPSSSSSTTIWSSRLRRRAKMDSVEILRGPNIKPFPSTEPLPETHHGQGAAQGGRQHHHRPHHAGRRKNPPLPLQHSVPLQFLLCASATRSSRHAAGSRARAS